MLTRRWRWRLPVHRLDRPSLLFLWGQAVSLLGGDLAVLAIPLLPGLSAASVTVGYLVAGCPLAFW